MDMEPVEASTRVIASLSGKALNATSSDSISLSSAIASGRQQLTQQHAMDTDTVSTTISASVLPSGPVEIAPYHQNAGV